MHVALSAYFWGQSNTGSGQYLERLAATLQAEYPDIRLTLLLPAEAAHHAPPPGDCQILPTPFDGRNRQLAKVWFEQIAVPRAAHRLRADLLHVPYFAPPLRATVPVVATIHDLIPLILPAYRGKPTVRLYSALVARAAWRTAMILADSEASRHDILRLLAIPPARVRTVYLAADVNFVPQSAQAVAAVRDHFQLPKHFVLYLGGFDQRKNVPLLLQAVAESNLDYPLVIAGRLPGRDTTFSPDPRRVARDFGLLHRVHFTGWVDESLKPALLAAATVFAFPSGYEGFGLPILEAMACGTPTVTSNSSSLSELAGSAAWLVAPNDANALKEALDLLMRDPAARAILTAAGPQQAALFSWHRCAAETMQTYEQVAGGR